MKHSGEEFIFVLKGKVTVRTEFYDAVTLSPGESIYIDSTMGHAYLTADEGEEAEVLAVMSSSDEELMNALLTLHEEQRQSGAPSRSMER